VRGGRGVWLAWEYLVVLLGGVDAVVAGGGVDDADLVAVLDGAELFEFFGLFQRGGRERDVLEQEVSSVGVEAGVLEELRFEI